MKNCLVFEKAGTQFSNYGYSFGEHLWEFKLMFDGEDEMNGIMIVGVMNRRFSNNKMFGGVVNYCKGVVRVRVLLDANKKRLTVFSPQAQEVDLPKDGLFYPALQNKTKHVLKVAYKFEL